MSNNVFRRRATDLRKFILQYFLKKFPTRNLALCLLKDFLHTMRNNFRQNLRYDYFLDMANLFEIKHKAGVDISSQYEQNIIKIKCRSLDKTFKFFVTTCLEVRTAKKTLSDYLIPNHENNNNNLIPINQATLISEKVFKAEGFSASKIKAIVDELPRIAEKDLFSRMLRNKSMNAQETNMQDRFISFDAMTSFLLESFVNSIVERLHNLHTNLRLFTKSRYESRVTFEEFVFAVIPHLTY